LYQDYPWTILSKRSQGGTNGATGIFFSMLDVLAEKLNFTYSVTSPKTTGARNREQYQKMIQQLRQHEVFMAVSPFVMTEKTLQEVTLSASVDLQEYAIMYKRPEELSRITLFVRPYSPFVSIFNIYNSFFFVSYNV
jgi:hypothetical protein